MRWGWFAAGLALAFTSGAHAAPAGEGEAAFTQRIQAVDALLDADDFPPPSARSAKS